MEDLAEQLAADINIFIGYLRSAQYPEPSFESSTPPDCMPNDAPEHVHQARERIMDNVLQLFDLAAGPSEFLNNLSIGYHYVACLHWLCRFNIFALVPLQGSISYAELASLAHVSLAQLKSITRMAMTMRLFREPVSEEVAHTGTSTLFRNNTAFYEWAVFLCEISAPTAAHMLEASLKWPGSVAAAETAYNVASDTDLPFFQHLAQLPGRAQQFSGYMRSLTGSPGNQLKHLVRGYDWAALGKALIVDVGGSAGHASVALAHAYQGLDFVVQDLPEVIDKAKIEDSSIKSRMQLQAGDFFQPQRISNADVYLLRMVLHDWSNEDAAEILANIVPAMGSQSKIIVMDIVMPTPGSVPRSTERLIRMRDMTMMQVFNSHERGQEDWKAVLRRADKRLSIRRIYQPPGSVMSLMEIVLA